MGVYGRIFGLCSARGATLPRYARPVLACARLCAAPQGWVRVLACLWVRWRVCGRALAHACVCASACRRVCAYTGAGEAEPTPPGGSPGDIYLVDVRAL